MTQSQQRFRRLSKFELHQLIGEGAMGVVWKAYDSVLRRYVALKLLNSSVGKTHAVRDRFLREARAAGALQHPNIVTVYDLGEAESQLFIAMELVEGRDLSEIIVTTEPLALERKLDIVIEILEGLHYAHQRGVIHRDVKPSNVRIMADGRVKIMDFGIARLQSADVTGEGAIVGTPNYMAPEQITNGAITPATDLFSVGCLLYELLSFQKPFEGESVHGLLYQVLTTDPKPLRTMAPSIPASLERVVQKAMNKVPEDRYDSARAMQQTLLGIRVALSGGTDSTTQRLGLRWTPLPGVVLKLVTHAPMKWRVAVLSALALVVAAIALMPSRPEEPAAAPARRAPTGPQLGRTLPGEINPALSALRDSALAARDRAERAGALKNGVRAALLGETLFQNGDRSLLDGDVPGASTGWREAVGYYRTAQREAEALRRETVDLIGRATVVVGALGTRPEAAPALASLARAESLLTAHDFTLSKLAAQNAEQVGIALGVAPPSPQPTDLRAAVEVLLQDLARAVASERVENIRVLYPGITPREERNWESFFGSAAQISARYTVRRFTRRGTASTAQVQALIRYVPEGGGVQREDLPRLEMRFTRTERGWRIAAVSGVR
ncbi:MAG: serine/threonine-protein kinase [Gemmatimonadales bacterium]